MRKSIIVVVFLAILAGIVSAIPAHAAGDPQMVDNNGTSSLCWNRAGGGTSIGTPVIAYNCGDPNNNFEEVGIPNMCGGGVVTQTCPFVVGSGLNSTYAGDEIISVEWGTTGKCVGGGNANDGDAKLTNCPNSDGTCPVNNSCWSAILIREPAVYPGTLGRNYDALINRHWSDWFVSNSNPPCHAFSCTLVNGAPFGRTNPIVLQVGDAAIRGGNPPGAQFYDVWANV